MFSLLVLGLLVCGCHGAAETSRPNIVLILADDLGWNDVGFHGSEIKTPNLDRLAYEGVMLTNYYVSPICTPTRSSLMTGRHPIHLGMQHGVILAGQPFGLPLNQTLMSGHLKRLGYKTHIVGKWHLGFFKTEYLPTNRGFDSHYGYWNGREDYYTHVDTEFYSGLDFRSNMSVVNVTGYSTEMYTAEAKRLINTHDTSQPLFLYMAYQAVHAANLPNTLQAPAKYVDRFPYIKDKKRRIFAGMVSALDDSVGSVVSALEQRGMMDNTILVFTTDNGGPANNMNGNAACNLPLRGTKATLWEGGVHGVGFVHSKFLKKPGIKMNNMIHVSDWLPTLYSAAGGHASDLGQIDGHDLWDMIQTNGSSVRKELLHNIDPVSKYSAVRVGDYKLIQGDVLNGQYNDWYPCNPPKQTNIDTVDDHMGNRSAYLSRIDNFVVECDAHRSLVKTDDTPYKVECGKRPKDYKTNCKPGKAPCLYNIVTDPCEYHNIADLYPTIVRQLQDRIRELSETAMTPGNKPLDKNADPALHGGIWVPWQGSKRP